MPSSTRASTRRRLLRSAAALVGAGSVAGCGGSASSSGSVSSGPEDPPEDAVTDPPMVALRAPRDVAVLRSDDATDAPTTAEIREWTHSLVADSETAASLSIAAVAGAAEARRFLDRTDFDAETVYVERHVVGECYEQRLCWIRWTDEEVETSYARVLRPAEASCSADARVGVTHLIRLPATLDPEQVSRFSSGSRSGVCRGTTTGDGGEGAGR